VYFTPQLQWSNEELAEMSRFGRLDEFHAAIEELSCPRYGPNRVSISKYADFNDDPFFPAQWYLVTFKRSLRFYSPLSLF
jgi:hypothetical protein